jgi:hypothetical protein
MNGTLIIDSSIRDLIDCKFANTENITKVIFESDKIRSIGHDCFNGCINLEEIEIPDSVNYIGYQAFYNCKKLKKVKLGKNLDSLNHSMFQDCINLEEIEIPSNIKVIHKDVFYSCKKLTKVKLNEGLLRIDTNSFKDCTNLNEISIPDSVRHITDRAFNACPNLVRFYINKTSKLQTFHRFVFGALYNKYITINPKCYSPYTVLYDDIMNRDTENGDSIFVSLIKDYTENPNSIFSYINKYNIELEDIMFLLDKKEYAGFLNGSNYGI